MVVHTEKFLEKQRARREEKEKEAALKARMKELFKEKAHEEKKKVRKDKYAKMKCEGGIEYEKYLRAMSEYREKYRLEKEAKNKQKVMNNLLGKNYRVIQNKAGHKYYITDNAILYNWKGEMLGTRCDKNGYRYVSIGAKRTLLHRLVWEAFNGEIPECFEIDHILPIKSGGTDELSNLRLASHRDNCNNPISIENYKKRWRS